MISNNIMINYTDCNYTINQNIPEHYWHLYTVNQSNPFLWDPKNKIPVHTSHYPQPFSVTHIAIKFYSLMYKVEKNELKDTYTSDNIIRPHKLIKGKLKKKKDRGSPKKQFIKQITMKCK